MVRWMIKLPSLAGVVAAILMTGLLSTFAIPVEQWRTGDQHVTELTYRPTPEPSNFPRRIWIDTDAACGYSRRTDPDDCFAIALLAQASGFQIVGISTVFGNAALEVVNHTTLELVSRLSTELHRPFSVYRGSAGPLSKNPPSPKPPAHDALAAALAQGPLTVLALGPLTNLAAVLAEHPSLQTQIAHVVAVMGKRPGHIFHPAEGARAGILFGHGPIFRDFNFDMDTDAAKLVLTSHLPVTLIPYDAARGIEMTADDLDHLSESNPVLEWIADRARPWLEYWRNGIGRQGFYPFDLLAAAYILDPSQFECASIDVRIGEDPTLFIPFGRSPALLVSENDGPSKEARVVGSTRYCGRPSSNLKHQLMNHFEAQLVVRIKNKAKPIARHVRYIRAPVQQLRLVDF